MKSQGSSSQKREGEQRETQMLGWPLSESHCQLQSDLFMRRYERVKACEGVRDKREREKEKEKEKGCC